MRFEPVFPIVGDSLDYRGMLLDFGGTLLVKRGRIAQCSIRTTSTRFELLVLTLKKDVSETSTCIGIQTLNL